MDLEKGIVSVRVTEHFRQFNGKERTIVCEKTAIVEQHMQKSITTEAVTKLQLKASQNNSTLSNAYEFYETYGGSKMVFEPGENREGMIYYGTRGKRAPTAKTRYENLGWQVTVKDSNGTVVEQIYYYIDGANMEKVDARDVDDYRYSLYCVSLENLKSRLSEEGCEALTHPDSSIIFDACITVVSNNVRQGGMSDSGISWGEVYTTYDGIVNARAWSDKTKEAMKSYYSKTVENMFYQVELICGDGITSVSGAGEYCYGT